MELPNTYIYRQSDLPPMTDEIKSGIAKIDFHGANLITEFKGHYLALAELTEVLANLLNSAELNLQCIRIIPDGSEPELLPRAIGLTDLPTLEKQLLISTAVTSTVAINMIAAFLGCSFEQAAAHVSIVSDNKLGGMSPDQVEKVVAEMAKQLRENPGKQAFVITVKN